VLTPAGGGTGAQPVRGQHLLVRAQAAARAAHVRARATVGEGNMTFLFGGGVFVFSIFGLMCIQCVSI
jgi:hypothetical protein